MALIPAGQHRQQVRCSTNDLVQRHHSPASLRRRGNGYRGNHGQSEARFRTGGRG